MNSIVPLFTGSLGTVFTAISSIFGTVQFQAAIGVLLGFVAVVFLALLASLIGWAIVVLVSRAINAYNPDAPPADEAFDAAQIGVPAFFSFAALADAFDNLFTSIGAQISSAAGFVVSNLIYLIPIALLFAGIFVWNAWQGRIIEAFANFESNFFLGFWRSTIVPLSSIIAFIGTQFVVLLDGVRRVVQSGTVITIERSLICGFPALQTTSLATADLFREIVVDSERYLIANGTSTALTRGPDYFPTGVQLGSLVASLRTFANCACQPLSDRLFLPLSVPFTQPAFANVVNNSIGIVAALVTQVLFRPIAVAVERARADPSANLTVDIVPPSFNASIDLLAFAFTNLTLFIDSFVPALDNTTTLFLEDLLGIPLPSVLPPRAGFLTATIGGLVDISLQLIKDVLNLVVNAIFNSGEVFGSEGFLFFRLDDAFEAFKRAVRIFDDYLAFFSTYLRQLGSIVANVERKRDVTSSALLRGFEYLPTATIGNLLQQGFNLFATFIDLIRCYVDGVFIQFLPPLGQLIVDLPVGTIYRTVRAVSLTGLPNIFAFAQELWGDASTFVLTCANPFGGPLFTAAVSSGCLSTTRFSSLCVNAEIEPLLRGEIVSRNYTFGDGFDTFESTCLRETFRTCFRGEAVFFSPDGRNLVAGIPSTRNRFREVLHAVSNTSRCTTDFFNNLCTQCSIFGVFLGQPLINVIVEAILLPLDILVHLDKVVTTPYLGACVRFKPLLDALRTFTDDVATSVELFNSGLLGVTCPVQSTSDTTVDVNSATILCAAAGVIRFGFRTLWGVVQQLTIAFQAIVLGVTAATGGIMTNEFTDIFSQLSFADVLADAHVAIVDVVALVFSILIPSSIPCADTSGFNLRAAIINALGNLLADIVLLIPTIVFDVISTIITGIVTGIDTTITTVVVDTVSRVFVAILGPILRVLGNSFLDFAIVLNCLTAATSIASVFIAIGNFLGSQGLIDGLQIVINILIEVIAIIVGLLQLLVTRHDGILSDAVDLLKQVIANIIITVFGLSTACGVQNTICKFSTSALFVFDACKAADQNVGSCFGTSAVSCATQIEFCADAVALITGVACPRSPFGCCSTQPFPANGSFPDINETPFVSCKPGQLCDQRFTCGWFLPTFAENDTALIPFLTMAPPGNPDAALGQSVRSVIADCPRFQRLTDCGNPGFLNPDGSPFTGKLPFSRSFGFQHAKYGKRSASGEPMEMMNFDYCERVVKEYANEGKLRSALTSLNAQHRRYFERALTSFAAQLAADPEMSEAMRCYAGLHPELRTQPGVRSLFTRFLGEEQHVSDAQASTATSRPIFDALHALRERGRRVYEANKLASAGIMVHARAHRMTSAAQRYATYSVHASRLIPRVTAVKDATARWLANAKLSDVPVQREQARVIVNSFFSSFHAEYRQHHERRIIAYQAKRSIVSDGDNEHDGSLSNALAHGVALLLHFADAVEHIAYAAHYHLNVRSADITPFGVGVIEQRRMHANSLTSAHSSLVHQGEQALPHPLSVLHAWAIERRAFAVQRLQEKFRRFIGSEDYVVAPNSHALRVGNLRLQHVAADDNYGHARVKRKILSLPHRLADDAQLAQRSRFVVTALLPNESTLSDLLGVQPCSTAEQIFCTNCAFLDSIVFAVEQQVNVTIDFYDGTLPRGFPELVDQFETTFHNTLIDPVGPDKYTTRNPRTKFILREFLTIDWPWMWDYSELRAIVFANDTTGEINAENAAVGFAERSDAAIAASQNRTDLDLMALNSTRLFIQPIINFLERVAFEATRVGSIRTIEALFERYIVCDYTKGLVGNDPHSTGLFSAIVITVLGLFVVGVFISLIPGAGMCFMITFSMFATLLFFPLVWWIGYNASPLCTLPSFFGGIPGVPTPFLADAQRLFEEFTPECPPINAGMIDPAFFAQASMTRCGLPGNVPPLIPCSEAAGFIDGLDNVFFIITSLYGEGVTLAAAAQLAPIAPDVAAVASIYTDAHIQALADRYDVGALCNFLTIGNILVLLLVLGVLAFVGAAAIAVILFFVGLLLIAIALGLYTNFIIWAQVRKGFLNWKRQYGSKLKTE